MFRRDLIHSPVLDEPSGEVRCADCPAVLDAEVAMTALLMAGVLVDVGGYGTAMYPAEQESLGGEGIKCSHPQAEAQRVTVDIRPCGCDGNTDCQVCEGSGVLAHLYDESGTDCLVAVNTNGLTYDQLTEQNLEHVSMSGVTDIERMATRAALQNWAAMREATRPEGVKSS